MSHDGRDTSIADLYAELEGLRQKIVKLEAAPGRWQRSERNKTVRLFALPILLASGMLYAQGTGDALFIDANGNVGIATNSPKAKLEVNGAAKATSLHVTQNLTTGGSVTAKDVKTDSAHIVNQVGIGAGPDPERALRVSSAGGIRISRNDNGSPANEVFFDDNGQIRSRDNNHRLIFDRQNNILELREYGKVIVSAGATNGERTDTLTVTSTGVQVKGTINGEQSPVEFFLPSQGNGKWNGVVKDISSHCGDKDGCRIDLLMEHDNGEVRVISEHIFIKGSRGWRRQAGGGGDASFNLSSRQHLFGPWKWFYASTYKHANYNGKDEDLAGFNIGFMSHPVVSTRVIIYDR